MYLYMTIALAANEVRPVAVYGRYFRVLDNSTATNPVVRIGSNSPQVIPAGVGIDLFDGVDPEANTFDQVMIQNPTGGVMTLNIAMSTSKVDDSRLSLTGTINVHSTDNALVGTYAADVTTGAAAKVVDKVNTVNGWRVYADSANTAEVYLGFDGTVSATKKAIALQPGMMWGEDNYKGDVYSFSAAAQKISVSQW